MLQEFDLSPLLHCICAGLMVPNLKQLKLNGSIIATVRDLGTSLDNLSVLWMARCNLLDLDGISSMSSLQVSKVTCKLCDDIY